MIRIAVVGGGLSGRLLVLNLLRRAPPGAEVHVHLIDRWGPGTMGPAYSHDSYDLLLNVPAEIMGASTSDPDEFRRWVASRRGRTDAHAFLPRRLFREYLFELIDETEAERSDDVTLEEVRGEVVDLAVNDPGATVHLADGSRVEADRVVLALGNFLPRQPPVRSEAVLQSERYIRNPWHPRALDVVSPADPVLFIGTGQTMTDLALMLQRRGHEGPLTAISRRGLLPMAHGSWESYPSFFQDLDGATGLRKVFGTIRRHVARAEAEGIDPRAVIDSLRPHTQTLWSRLPEVEKRRFMRHAFRYWERIRSRIPPESRARLETLLESGQLRIVAGRVRDLVDKGTEIEVHYTPRRRSGEIAGGAAYVINCIGPEADYRRVDDRLVRNLLRRGLIRPGPASIGMATRPDGSVIGRNGPSDLLFTLGSTMKGLLWEVLAVPDIRVQAEELAPVLLGGAGAR